MENALKYANNITDTLRPTSKTADSSDDAAKNNNSSNKSDPLSDVEIYKSSIPSQYGGRISSVLNITGKEAK